MNNMVISLPFFFLFLLPYFSSALPFCTFFFSLLPLPFVFNLRFLWFSSIKTFTCKNIHPCIAFVPCSAYEQPFSLHKVKQFSTFHLYGNLSTQGTENFLPSVKWLFYNDVWTNETTMQKRSGKRGEWKFVNLQMKISCSFDVSWYFLENMWKL